jgi:hypothetical protein
MTEEWVAVSRVPTHVASRMQFRYSDRVGKEFSELFVL